jgi:hypothetical protein
VNILRGLAFFLFGGFDLEDLFGKQRLQADQDRRAQGGARLRLEPFDGLEQVLAVGRRSLHRERGLSEGDHADLGGGGLFLDEFAGCLLRGGEARRRHVVSQHAVGDVDGENDDVAERRQADDRHRPRHGRDQEGQRDAVEDWRQDAARTRDRGRVCAPAPARGADRDRAPAPFHRDVGQRQHRHQQQCPEQDGPLENHDSASR